MTINEKLNNIQENVILANHTTFRIGGPAKYFFEAKTKEDLIKAMGWARENNISYFILGGGSNLLASDKGYEGLVIKVKSSKFAIEDNKITAEAGAPLFKLVIESANSNLTGLEWAAGIPGTIGGAVCGNAGAYGHSISESVVGCHTINSKGEFVNFNKDDCGFYYRGSAFKDASQRTFVLFNPSLHSGNGLVIVEIELKLENDKNGQAQETIKKNLADRRNKIPAFPSAGSFFKNYVLERENPEKDPLIERFPELKTQIKGGKLAARFLIGQCGLKGKTVGGAQISEQHGNFIVNIGGAKSSDVLELAQICKERVKEKFGVELEEETKFLGF